MYWAFASWYLLGFALLSCGTCSGLFGIKRLADEEPPDDGRPAYAVMPDGPSAPLLDGHPSGSRLKTVRDLEAEHARTQRPSERSRLLGPSSSGRPVDTESVGSYGAAVSGMSAVAIARPLDADGASPYAPPLVSQRGPSRSPNRESTDSRVSHAELPRYYAQPIAAPEADDEFIRPPSPCADDGAGLGDGDDPEDCGGQPAVAPPRSGASVHTAGSSVIAYARPVSVR